MNVQSPLLAPPLGRPYEIDLSPHFEALDLPRRDQGKRPTCSVFTLAHALDHALAVGSEPGVPVSVEYLNWSARQGRNRSDDGGFFSEIWAGFEAFGWCSEASSPYQEAFDPAWEPDVILRESACNPAVPLRLEWIKEWDPESGATPEQMDRIRAVLAGGSPVCAGMRWPREPVWTGDVLQLCAPEAVYDGHSVLLVGYRTDDSLPGGGAFRIRNSSRPASGFLPFDYVAAYLNDAAWIAPAAAKESPT